MRVIAEYNNLPRKKRNFKNPGCSGEELDLTEGRSTGISKIIRAMAANGSPAPEFETADERSNFLIRLMSESLLLSRHLHDGQRMRRQLGHALGEGELGLHRHHAVRVVDVVEGFGRVTGQHLGLVGAI